MGVGRGDLLEPLVFHVAGTVDVAAELDLATHADRGRQLRLLQLYARLADPCNREISRSATLAVQSCRARVKRELRYRSAQH